MSTARRRIAVVLGTRPESVKLAEVIRQLGEDAWVIHTGQHHHPGLASDFFAELGLAPPAVTLGVGSVPRAGQIGKALTRLGALFASEMPAAVVVQGDTNATLAGALAANAAGIPLVHVEAGLRSFDRAMPEEHNRVVTDHLADVCCAPTDVSVRNLRAEGIAGDRIALTGNTVVEAAVHYLPDAARCRALVHERGLTDGRYVLATFHRPENVDDPETLALVLEQLVGLDVGVVLPMHPRAAARAEEFGLGALTKLLHVVTPLHYREFLALAARSALLVSDSGGVQEEASVLKRPVIVVRRSTERPEVLGTFATRVEPGAAVGDLARAVLADLGRVHAELASIPTPYGDGRASARCVRLIRAIGRGPGAAAPRMLAASNG